MTNAKVCFIANDVKGLQSSKKRLKFIEYLKNKLESNGVLFLQETHSASDDENAWAHDFKGQKAAWYIQLPYLGSTSFVVKNKRNDDVGRILILDVTTDDNDYISVNTYNANTETEQIKILNNLHFALHSLDVHQNKHIILIGYFNFFPDTNLEAKGDSSYLKKKTCSKINKNRRTL